MNTLTASEARANLYRLIDQTVESHEPIIISGKRSSAVLLSAEDWSAIQETLYLLAVPGMRESIKAGMAEQFLNGANVIPCFKQVRCETVAHLVWCDVFIDAGALRCACNDCLDVTCC